MSEGISMEVLKAEVQSVEDSYSIKIEFDGDNVSIPLSEDKPNDVKAAFNKLIVRLKSGLFCIELDECGEDLFSQVAKEYLVQLNREVQEVYGEMENHGLIKT